MVKPIFLTTKINIGDPPPKKKEKKKKKKSLLQLTITYTLFVSFIIKSFMTYSFYLHPLFQQYVGLVKLHVFNHTSDS